MEVDFSNEMMELSQTCIQVASFSDLINSFANECFFYLHFACIVFVGYRLDSFLTSRVLSKGLTKLLKQGCVFFVFLNLFTFRNAFTAKLSKPH